MPAVEVARAELQSGFSQPPYGVAVEVMPEVRRKLCSRRSVFSESRYAWLI